MLRITTEPSSRKALRNWMQPPPYIMNRELSRRGTEDRLFVDWPGPAAGVGRIQPDEESLLFKQLHCSGYRMSKTYQAATKAGRVTPTMKREYALWVQRYNQIRSRLTEGNLGLVYDLIGRSRFDNLERSEMTSEGMMALLRAVDTFDPWRGYRFSTYACNAILRAFSRAALASTKGRSKIAGPYDPEFEKSDHHEVRTLEQRALYSERLRFILDDGKALLTDVEKSVLARRFPDNDTKRETLERIGVQMQVSKERVRQIQLSAFAKLRRAIATDAVLS